VVTGFPSTLTKIQNPKTNQHLTFRIHRIESLLSNVNLLGFLQLHPIAYSSASVFNLLIHLASQSPLPKQNSIDQRTHQIYHQSISNCLSVINMTLLPQLHPIAYSSVCLQPADPPWFSISPAQTELDQLEDTPNLSSINLKLLVSNPSSYQIRLV
jgi:hypothetical protein